MSYNHPHLLIRASAGTGKTYALTTRMLDLLLQGAAPTTILATTFTRNAAGEIAERLLSRLAGARLDTETREALAEDLGRALDDAVIDVTLKRVAAQLGRLQVGTIDSWFNQVAAGMAWELGFPPGWSIADQRQLQQQRQATLQDLFNAPHDGDLEDALDALDEDKARRSVMQSVESAVHNLGEQFSRLVGPGSATIWDWFPQPEAPISDQKLDGLVAALRTAEVPLTKKENQPYKAFVNAVDGLCRRIEQRDWESIPGSTTLLDAVQQTEAKFSSRPVPDSLRAACLAVLDACFAELAAAHRRKTVGVYYFLTRYDQAYLERIRRSGWLGFRDVTRWLTELNPDQRRQLYYRLDTQYDHVLLDEFQDTSISQWDVLQPLVGELFANADGSQSTFIVGDAKQAIYRWRGGVHELFDVIERRYDVEVQARARNFRSAAVVLDFVNDIFSTLDCVDSNNAAFKRTAAEWAHTFPKHMAATSRTGYVRVELIDADASGDAEDDDDSGERTGSCLDRAAATALELAAAHPTLHIGLLTRTNQAANALRLQLPVAAEQAGPVRTFFVQLMRFADHPGNSAAERYVRHNDLFNGLCRWLKVERHTESARLALAVRSGLHRYGAETFVRSIFQHQQIDIQPLTGVFADLLGLAANFDAGTWQRVSEFADLVQQTPPAHTKDAGRIDVMTIHQAKGLQFDAVLLADFSRRLVQQYAPVTLVEHFEADGMKLEGAFLRPRKSLQKLAPDTVIDALINDDARDMHEALSLLYVALTRAKHGLYLFLESDANKDTFADVLRQQLATKFDADGRYTVGEPDWWQTLHDTAETHNAPEPLQLQPPSPTALKRFGRLRPSGLAHDETISAAERLRVDNQEAFAFGDAVHGCLEQFTWIEDRADWEVALAQQPQTIREFLVKALNQPAVAQLLHSDSYRSGAWSGLDLVVLNEHRFAILVAGELQLGAVDRLVVGKRNGRIVKADIIDFKTDRLGDSGPETKAERYRPQLEAYAAAIQQQMHLDPGAVTARLLFLQNGDICPVV